MNHAMVSAIVLVNTEIDAEKRVLGTLKGLDGVEEAHALDGAYDLMVRVKTESYGKLREIVEFGIKQVVGVFSALTLLLVE